MLEKVMEFLIPSLWAMGAPAQGGGAGSQNPVIGFFLTFLPLILIFLIFYFLLIRPQQKRVKEHQKFLESLRVGQKVFTNGGVVGRIVKIEGDVIWLEVDKDLNIPVLRSYIAGPYNVEQR